MENEKIKNQKIFSLQFLLTRFFAYEGKNGWKIKGNKRRVFAKACFRG